MASFRGTGALLTFWRPPVVPGFVAFVDLEPFCEETDPRLEKGFSNGAK